MIQYIVFLRGINVSGSNIVKMTDLRTELLKSELEDVKTYIQSGNLIVKSELSQNEVRTVISNTLQQKFSIDTSIFILTINELKSLVKINPFLSLENDNKRIMVSFLDSKPDHKEFEKLILPSLTDEFLTYKAGYIFGHFPNGYGKSRFSNNFLEKKLKIKATTRNWNTIEKLIALAEH